MYKESLYDVRKIENIKDMFVQSSELFADKTAFLVKKEDGYLQITYKQFKSDVDSFGTALINMGLKDKKIAVLGENRYEWAVAYMAIVCGVGIVVPLDKELPGQEIDSLIEAAGLDAIVYSKKMESIISAAPIGIKICMDSDMPGVIEAGSKRLEAGDDKFVNAAIDPYAMQILLFTSGTTDNAKAVMLCHNNLAKNIMGTCSMIKVTSNDVLLSVLPLHHTYECTCGFLTPIYCGCAIAYCEGLRHITKNLKEAQVTIMLAVPLLLEGVYKKIWKQAEKSGEAKKLKLAVKISNSLLKIGIDKRKKLFAKIHNTLGGNLRLLISGAAAIDPVVSKGLRAFGIEVLQGYGLTECSPIAALNRDIYYKDESAGLPMPGVKIEIVNPDEDGIGEIVVDGDNVMLGYYNNKEATEKTLIDGKLYTGDLGFLDAQHFLHITGRKKNVIVTKNGKNIFPEELETYLCRSNYIQEAMVYGVDKENDDTAVFAQIYPDYDAVEERLGTGYSKEDLKKLIESEVLEVNHNLQNFKRISKTIIRDEEFVKTTTKKIKRHIETGKDYNQ